MTDRSPNLTDYDTACRSFSWEAVRRELAGLPGGKGLNIAHEAVDRHAEGSKADRVALRCVARDGRVENITYGELCARTNRFVTTRRWSRLMRVEGHEGHWVTAIRKEQPASCSTRQHSRASRPRFSQG